MNNLRPRNLLVQTMLLMTLALLPLGAVAIFQTNRVATEAENSAQLALLAVTGRAAKTEELLIERAFGVAQFFGSIAGDFVDDPDACTEHLGSFIENDDTYSFIGILPISGLMTCSSTGQDYDFSSFPNFKPIMDAQKRSIEVNRNAALTGKSVFIVSEPFELDGAFAGFISISIPHDGLPNVSDQIEALGLQELVTFNADGEILTARSDIDTAALQLPASMPLDTLSTTQTRAFKAKNTAGEARRYTVVPIEGSPATVMGIWRVDTGLGNHIAAFIQPALFPVLMWVASMSVAMLSIYTLVLRHMVQLRKAMDNFAKNRRMSEPEKPMTMPIEFQSLNDNFEAMAQNIMQDEAKLEDSLREKNVLIKEVHHRVKNNLQLISSIMNMQIREAESEETKTVLARLQDRIISLATIHRDLYQSQNAGRVNSGALVTDIVEKTLELATSGNDVVDVTTNIELVLLFPDQAVPLSLLMAEGMTNAMKYISSSENNKPWLKVSLVQADDTCTVSIENSVGASVTSESTGLGAQLITAFGIQLGGKIDVEKDDDRYAMTVHFKIAEFTPETPDF
ncbi:putative sensor histidine kinase pdtaS [Ascidiaceihabitans donghaensis]|uniref:histidine kinase n=2 Tax=Ascidiaceihabitans donghaensis TaxID=1510460 RepID=A0A2R8B963_9RHOB|nr:putative sensor histidine kinase pdtaS [Ascidiaceihabitans donghaensis]